MRYISTRGSSVALDFYITRERPDKGCYPFDKDRMVEKTFDHVYSTPNPDPRKRRDSALLRHEILRIMREQLGTTAFK